MTCPAHREDGVNAPIESIGMRHCGRDSGFTLIESMTVVAILAISLAIAIPNLRDFLVKNKIAGLSNEFSGAMLQARAWAISKNSCVTLCTASVSASTTPTCSATQTDYQQGWIIFRNSACNTSQTTPDTDGLLAARMGESNGYQIKPLASGLSSITFDPRGTAALSSQGIFQVLAPGAASTFNRNVCVDVSGRSSVRKYDATTCL